MTDAVADVCAAYFEDDELIWPRGRTMRDGIRGKRAERPKGPRRQRIKQQNGRVQYDREFNDHKLRVMANLSGNMCDNSPKGGVDRKCSKLMELLNNHPDYFTVSSCSGRIALFHSTPIPGACPHAVGSNSNVKDGEIVGKRGSKQALGWLVVKHGELTEQEINVIVNGICGEERDDGSSTCGPTSAVEPAGQRGGEGEDELGGVWIRSGVLEPAPLPALGTVTLKMEPFVMHVACRTIEDGKRLLTVAATEAGFRNSGVTPPGKRVLCAIRHAMGVGLDVPLVVDGVNYARGQQSYVRRLLLLANEKMRNNDLRRRRLEAGVAGCLQRGQDSPAS